MPCRGIARARRGYGKRDKTRPVSTGRGTRRVQLVREGGGSRGACAARAGRAWPEWWTTASSRLWATSCARGGAGGVSD